MGGGVHVIREMEPTRKSKLPQPFIDGTFVVKAFGLDGPSWRGLPQGRMHPTTTTTTVRPTHMHTHTRTYTTMGVPNTQSPISKRKKIESCQHHIHRAVHGRIGAWGDHTRTHTYNPPLKAMHGPTISSQKKLCVVWNFHKIELRCVPSPMNVPSFRQRNKSLSPHVSVLQYYLGLQPFFQDLKSLKMS